MNIAHRETALKDMDTRHLHYANGAAFFSMQLAPMDGTAIRVLILDRAEIRELPWRVRFAKGHWRYETTGAIVHSWHEPAAWSTEERTPEFQAECEAVITKAFGAMRVRPWQT